MVLACTTGPTYSPPPAGFRFEAKKKLSVILTKSAQSVMSGENVKSIEKTDFQ